MSDPSPRMNMTVKVFLFLLCLFPGVSHFILGRTRKGFLLLFLAALAFNGLLLLGPSYRPRETGDLIQGASLGLLVGLWGYTIYSLISLSFRGLSLEMEKHRQKEFKVGVAHYLKSDMDTARSSFEEMTDLDANDPDAQFHLAMIYKRKGMAKEAKRAFKKSLSLDSEKWAWEIQQELKNL